MRNNALATPGNAALLMLLAFLLMPEWSRTLQGQGASTALGQSVKRFIQEWADETHTVVKTRIETIDSSEVAPQAVSTNYDNWSPLELGGQTRTLRVIRTGGDEVGDDAQLIGNTGGRLSSMGWSLCNLSQRQTLLQWTQTFRWYDSTGGLIASRSQIALAPPGGIGPGVFALFLQTDGFWTPFNIVLPNSVFVSVQFTNTVGMNNDDVGLWLAGPPTLSSSQRTYRNFTTNQFVDPGADSENLAAFIRTEVIPTPATSLALAASGLLATRRRRPANT
jgi:hypothetical protein